MQKHLPGNRINYPRVLNPCATEKRGASQIRKGSTAMSTSTRNFPNRLGIDTRVYPGSAELAAVEAVNAKAAEDELRPDCGVQGSG